MRCGSTSSSLHQVNRAEDVIQIERVQPFIDLVFNLTESSLSIKISPVMRSICWIDWCLEAQTRFHGLGGLQAKVLAETLTGEQDADRQARRSVAAG